MARILVIKTAALGDVLRTTSILPGLHQRHPGCEVVWVTAPGARDLVAHHPLVARVDCVDSDDAAAVEALGARLAGERWDRVLSFEEELVLCRLAVRVAAGGAQLTGACLDASGAAGYTDDAEPWFGMGLLARDGRAAADARKRANRCSHPAIFAGMLEVPPGRPELPLDAARSAAARARLPAGAPRPWIGLNTGAGARWPTKALPEAQAVELVERLHARFAGDVSFVLFGGAGERERNARLRAAVAARVPEAVWFDSGCDNDLLDFAALIDCCDLLVTSDSLGMHIAIARRVRTVAFFAPTSAAEIELFGLGEKVVSTAPDYCSYRPDADNATLTADRLESAVLAQLQHVRPGG